MCWVSSENVHLTDLYRFNFKPIYSGLMPFPIIHTKVTRKIETCSRHKDVDPIFESLTFAWSFSWALSLSFIGHENAELSNTGSKHTAVSAAR